MARANLTRLGALPATGLLSKDLNLNRIWLWPNLLSLDAVCVALLWQQLFASAAAVDVEPAERIALGLAVWIIYILDRVFDTGGNVSPPSTRHQFYLRYRPFSIAVSQLALGTEIFVCASFGKQMLLAGTALSLIVAVYFFGIHFHPGMRRFLPKEAVVALVFSTGTALVTFTKCSLTVSLAASVLLFAAICLLNCTSIECFEYRYFGGHQVEPPSAWTTWPVGHFRLIALGIAFAATGLLLISGAQELFGSIAITALGLVWFDQTHRLMSPEQMRVAADLPLVLPALLLLARAYGL